MLLILKSIFIFRNNSYLVTRLFVRTRDMTYAIDFIFVSRRVFVFIRRGDAEVTIKRSRGDPLDRFVGNGAPDAESVERAPLRHCSADRCTSLKTRH